MKKIVRTCFAALMCLILCGEMAGSGAAAAEMNSGIQPRESANVANVGYYIAKDVYNAHISFNNFANGYFSLTVKKYSPGRDPIWQYVTSATQSFDQEIFSAKEVRYNLSAGTYKLVLICTSTVLGNTETKTYESGDFIIK